MRGPTTRQSSAPRYSGPRRGGALSEAPGRLACTVRRMRDFRPQSEKSRFDRVLQAFAQTRLGGWLFINVLPAVDRPLLRLSGGRASTGMGQTYVLLHVRGAKSGIERTIPLLGTKW